MVERNLQSMIRLVISAAVGSLVFATSVSAKVTPHGLFGDHAVLQRDRPIPVWGESDRDGEKVTVTLGGHRAAIIPAMFTVPRNPSRCFAPRNLPMAKRL